MQYYDKFARIHELLKEYGCTQTYKWEEQYREDNVIVGGCIDSGFYEPFENIRISDRSEPGWKETVVAKLDVTIPTKMHGAESGKIRFDINYSERVNKYSMYISLPTHGRSISLSKDVYNQDGVTQEIMRWLKQAGCRRVQKAKVIVPEYEQLSLI